MTITIRPAQQSDSPQLSYICLATADAGKSAVHLHNYKEFPGLVWAEPYVHLPATWGFVLVDDEKDIDHQVVGYTLGATDTREYEKQADEKWWPGLREKYSKEKVKETGTSEDIKYAEWIWESLPMSPLSELGVKFSKAHLHIDILDEYQGQGWGRKLIASAVEHLRGLGLDGVWLGLDPRNNAAKVFYARLGFKALEGADENHLGLKFVDFKG
ncbi:acyl-CoA N-acyltransferase [Pluteus cervinus]|uniref:Acyl-CoA N-acyltransferase n=1 Tax=Pluteus cervinus TaxID=181527 RepID=A0ACD3BDR7_9AGAR|nr:acyl-CoA N-acyltransferase [Pluteus cervinus]